MVNVEGELADEVEADVRPEATRVGDGRGLTFGEEEEARQSASRSSCSQRKEGHALYRSEIRSLMWTTVIFSYRSGPAS